MLVPIDKVVQDACLLIGDTSKSYYESMVAFVNQGMSDLYTHFLPEADKLTVKSTSFTGGNGVIPAPKDMVTYTKIGVCRNGVLIEMGLNEDLCEPDTCGCDETSSYADPCFYNWDGNDIRFGEQYWMGDRASRGGFYKYNRKTQEFYFTNVGSEDEVVIEYRADPASSGGVTHVPSEAQAYLRFYAVSCQYMSRRDTNSAAQYRAWALGERKKAVALWVSHNITEWHDLILKNTNALKR
jgi:hypothetical protein